jgi:hydroxymethylglutaryl-CoA lyase
MAHELQAGVRTVDCSIAGLGGCPYAPGATGNVATEDVVYALHNMGYKTGIDLRAAAEVGAWISNKLGRPNASRAGPALLAKEAREAKSRQGA